MSSRTHNPFWGGWKCRNSSRKAPSFLNSGSTIVELGCGISGLLALALGPSIHHYVATDQDYVYRLMRLNIRENAATALQMSQAAAITASATSSISTPHSKSGDKNRTGKKQKNHKRTTTKNKIHEENDDDDGYYENNSGQDYTNKKLNVTFTPLDWELDDPKTLKSAPSISRARSHSIKNEKNNNKNRSKNNEHGENDPAGDPSSVDPNADPGFDFLVSCDCIYNEALIPPFVKTAVEICRLRPTISSCPVNVDDVKRDSEEETEENEDYDDENGNDNKKDEYDTQPVSGQRQHQRHPTICLVAQQQRSPDVFEAWLRESLQYFRVWRLGDDVLSDCSPGGDGDRPLAAAGLGTGSGFVVHCLVLKE
jgi:hypothetical protein